MIFVDCLYNPKSGSYAKFQSIKNNRYVVETWWHCRDLFHKKDKNMNLFFFAHDLGKEEQIFSFLREFERRLNLPPSEFGITQRKNIIWIKPSKWWLKGFRKYLLTILLRCGENYNGDFEEALFSGHLKKTKYAIEKFMNGYTVCLGKKRGWCRQFSKLNEKEIDNILVKDDSPV